MLSSGQFSLSSSCHFEKLMVIPQIKKFRPFIKTVDVIVFTIVHHCMYLAILI